MRRCGYARHRVLHMEKLGDEKNRRASKNEASRNRVRAFHVARTLPNWG